MKANWNLLLRLFGFVVLVSLYGFILVAAGHGVGPIFFLLVLAAHPAWLPGVALGWLGLVICFVAPFRVDARIRRSLLTKGVGVLLLSVGAFSVASEAPLLTVGMGIPLLLVFLYLLDSLYRKDLRDADASK